MKILLQAKAISEATKSLPTFSELAQYYGPTVSIIIGIMFIACVVIIWILWYQYKQRLRDKEVENERLTKVNEQLSNRLLDLTDKFTGYVSSGKKNNL